ncbi:hypothetical protein [Methanoregula sp. UBA64]|jgi:hypothetical protein|uniref:hypothetical protein n=1 Tax=Methanoregula sp. UBA64 TaxID=1915554 RepID=UPI0025E1610D|nr:hypothetical protein [Methanoregula sp. UBA64]
MTRDDAVAPVIAAMLVLAVIVTFFAVWNATAIPSMKAQAEVSHLHEVEEGMLRFSSDIESAASMPASMKLSERIPLGGGDILYSSTKSGGILTVQREDPYLGIRLYNVSGRMESSRFVLSNISYRPAGNFWQDQGYVWSRGYVNVTKGSVSVPLEYPTMREVAYNITDVLFSARVISYGSDPGTCSVIEIKCVNITPGETQNSLSGNGIGTLSLGSTVAPPERFSNVTRINVTVFAEAEPLSGFPLVMQNAVNASLANIQNPVCSNIRYDTVHSTSRTTALIVDPLPNVTVIRQTTAITIGTK